MATPDPQPRAAWSSGTLALPFGAALTGLALFLTFAVAGLLAVAPLSPALLITGAAVRHRLGADLPLVGGAWWVEERDGPADAAAGAAGGTGAGVRALGHSGNGVLVLGIAPSGSGPVVVMPVQEAPVMSQERCKRG